MVAFAYVIPILACLILHLEFGYREGWTAYFWIIILGESFVGVLHCIFYNMQTLCTEYLGSLLTDIVREESWTELIEKTESKRDGNGNSYTVSRIEEKFHPDKFYFHTTLGSEIKTDYGFYSYVRGLWGLPGYSLSWRGKAIKGGVRYGHQLEMNEFDSVSRSNPKNWVAITERNSYTNKIRASNSIFKFEKISKHEAQEMGLLDYPEISRYDAPCVLSKDIFIPDNVDDMFRKFNAKYAPELQMRLYVLLFDAAKGIGISEHQRTYWQGGNKNEFVICIGLTPDLEIVWARAFSWSDDQTKEIEIAQWLMKQRELDWDAFHDRLKYCLTDWKRKEFKDFDYINVSLSLWQIIVIICLSIAENSLALYITIK